MIENTRYDRRYEAILRHFLKRNVLLLFFEDLVQDENLFCNKLFQTLGLSPVCLAVDRGKKNSSSNKFYDTLPRRILRQNQYTARLAHKAERTFSSLYSLWRRPFSSPITWPVESKEKLSAEFRQRLVPFLESHGKSAGFWFPKRPNQAP